MQKCDSLGENINKFYLEIHHSKNIKLQHKQQKLDEFWLMIWVVPVWSACGSSPDHTGCL